MPVSTCYSPTSGSVDVLLHTQWALLTANTKRGLSGRGVVAKCVWLGWLDFAITQAGHERTIKSTALKAATKR